MIHKIEHCDACGRENVDGELCKGWPTPGKNSYRCLLCYQITDFKPTDTAIIQALGIIYDEIRALRASKENK
jgi:DTW domain-containing protein YfiP